MKKPETKIKNEVYDFLNSYGGYWLKMSGSEFLAKGIPDIIGCYDGKFIGIEIKTKEGKLDLAQRWHLEKIKRCNGKSIVLRGFEREDRKRLLEFIKG